MRVEKALRIASALVLLAQVSLAAASQSPQTSGAPPRDARDGDNSRPGTISGSVVNQESRAPVRRVIVELRTESGEVRGRRSTDGNGRFAFTAVSRGRYTVHASKPGYLDAVYGQRAPGPAHPGTTVDLTATPSLQLVVQIQRGGVLGGIVTDEVGEPEAAVEVRALRVVARRGRPTVEAAGSSRTNDIGEFRIAGLPPGEYVLMSNLPPAGSDETEPDVADRTVSYAPEYFPGAPAAPIVLGIGEQRLGLNFPVLRRMSSRVSGTVSGGDASVLATTTVDLVPIQSWSFLPVRSVGLDRDGGFVFEGVSPGVYSLVAQSGIVTRIVTVDGKPRLQMSFEAGAGDTPIDLERAERRWGSTDVTVQESEVSGVAVALQPGMRVAGRVVFDTGARRTTDRSKLSVVMTSTDFGDRNYAALGLVRQDGTFVIDDVMPGRYRIDVSGRAGWHLRSAVIGDVDVLDEQFVIRPNRHVQDALLTLTDKPSRLVGAVRTSDGVSLQECTVVVFSVDDRYWKPESRRVVSTRPSTDNRFAVAGMPAGSYRISAITDWDISHLNEPSFLNLLIGRSTTVEVREADTVSVQLTCQH